MNEIKKLMFLFAIALVILSTLCFAQIKTTIYYQDNGTTINMSRGDALDIVLSENPTTGYRWYIVQDVRPILSQNGQPEFKPDSNLVGAGGKATHHFIALRKGTTQIRFDHKRIWEKKTQPTKMFRVVVKVNDR